MFRAENCMQGGRWHKEWYSGLVLHCGRAREEETARRAWPAQKVPRLGGAGQRWLG